MPTASLYVRLSREAGADNTSLAGMLADLRALAARLGAGVVAERVDDGKSGAIRDRPAFTAWLDDARSGRADLLLAYHGDRLTREGVNAAALVLDVLEGKDSTTGAIVRPPVRLVTADGLDSERDAESFRWRFVIAAEVARAERERITARNRDAQRRLRDARRFRGGTPPYGYRVVPGPEGGKALAVEPDEAAAIRLAADVVLGGGTLYAAVQALNATDARPRRARAWSITGLQAILTGWAVLGVPSHRGEPVRSPDGLPEAVWPPVLPLADAERLRALLAPSGRGPGVQRRRRAARLLSGLIACASCGALLRVNACRGTTSYACRGPHEGSGCSAPAYMRAPALEALVAADFLARYGRMAEVRPVETVREPADLAAVERALADLSAAIARPGADVPALAEQIGALQARRTDLAALPAVPVVEPVPTGRTIAEAWDSAPTDVRRDLLAQVLTGPILLARATEPERVAIPWPA